MGASLRAAGACIAGLAIAASPGCRRDTNEAARSEVAFTRDVPVDRARPGEIAAGDERAFGLAVPRLMNVTARFSDVLFASGRLPAEGVANYVRERVSAEHVETGPAKTVFTGVHVTEADAGERVLRIEVVAQGSTTGLVVRDETPGPAAASGSTEERLKAYGLTPEGELIDSDGME